MKENTANAMVERTIKEIESIVAEWKPEGRAMIERRRACLLLLSMLEESRNLNMEGLLLRFALMFKSMDDGVDDGFYRMMYNAVELWFDEYELRDSPREQYKIWKQSHRHCNAGECYLNRIDDLLYRYQRTASFNPDLIHKEGDRYVFEQLDSVLAFFCEEESSAVTLNRVLEYFRFKQGVEYAQEAYALVSPNDDCTAKAQDCGSMKRCKYIQRTIDLGLMDENEKWITDKVSNYQIALWVEMYAEKNDRIARRKWAWAEEKFGISGLAKYRNYSINIAGKVVDSEIIESCFKLK